ncbi:uncharacterized protein LOC119140913, partial [Falco rusticolus]|uniref:uncharacterized protein LOC119140913 n=1 Tax=Falco rusticolus TaxID=120794 RepID=UPI0018866FA1
MVCVDHGTSLKETGGVGDLIGSSRHRGFLGDTHRSPIRKALRDVPWILRKDWQDECKLTDGDNFVMAVTADNKKVKRCCSTCEIGKGCLKKKIVTESDDGPELDISPLRRERNQGRESRAREQAIEPDSSGTGDVEERLSEIVIHTPVSRRTRQQTQTIAPLRQGVGSDGPVYVKVPFTAMDLMTWKQAAGNYREDPEKVGKVADTITRTQNPDWNDLQVILDNVLDDTEKQMVLKAGKAQAELDVMSGITGGTIEQNFPSGDPQWDPNNVTHRERLRRYQKWVLYGIRHAMPKSLNWSKLYEVRQDKNESPSAFWERLKEAARKYTDLRVETEAAQMQLALIFMGQSAPDIRKKLQKLEGENSRSLNTMLEVAWRVYNNREREERKSRRTDLLAVMTGTIPEPRNIHELRAFLGMTGWCRLWIMNYGLIAKPLYEAQKNSPFAWGPQQQKAFVELKRALMSAPALGLLDLTKDFQLFVHERQHLALGVLTQRIGSWKRPVGYFSKQLDTVSRGWPNCLRAVAATVMLIQEARKLTLGRTITVYVPHMVITVLEQKGGHWLSPSRMMKYQVVLTEQDDVILKTTNLVNPAVFLSSIQEEGRLEHDCLAAIEYVYSSREDLKDVPLERPDWELYSDGSSFMEQGVRYAGYAVTTETTVIEAGALASTTSAQKAELIALIRALEISKDKKVNIWTD